MFAVVQSVQHACAELLGQPRTFVSVLCVILSARRVTISITVTVAVAITQHIVHAIVEYDGDVAQLLVVA